MQSRDFELNASIILAWFSWEMDSKVSLVTKQKQICKSGAYVCVCVSGGGGWGAGLGYNFTHRYGYTNKLLV